MSEWLGECAFVERHHGAVECELGMPGEKITGRASGIVGLPMWCAARNVVETLHNAVRRDDIRTRRNELAI